MTRRITHPNVVKVFDLGTWREMKYITMEYIDGVNLEQWVRLRSAIDINEGVRLAIDIANGLASAHALGIIHRDIKPQNILLKDASIPKILDFGIAQGVEGDHMTTAGFVMGSPKYMSPEQIQGQPLDVRSDVYSLGVVMYFLFTGREPFMGESPSVIAYKHVGETPRPPRDINPDMPQWLNNLILKTLAKDRSERHPTVEALGKDLRQGLAAVGAAQR
jgi:eukaryotic-like serine/threonine-protein kinase